MLRKLTIAGFKSIRKQSLDLGRTNLFIGQNGAGKSNILEACGMLACAITGGISYPTLGAKGVRASAPSVYRSALRDAKRPQYFDLEAEFDSLKYHCNIFSTDSTPGGSWNFHSESFKRKGKTGRWKNFAGRSGNGVKIDGQSFEKSTIHQNQSIISALELLGSLTEDEAKNIKSLGDYAIFSPFTSILRGVASDHSLTAPLGLYGGSLPAAINDVMAGANRKKLTHFFEFFPWFRSIGISNPDPKIMDKQMPSGKLVLSFADKYMVKGFNKLYSSDVSEGALYGAFILTLMLHDNAPRILALDNVDSTLNPGLVRRLVKTISELSKDHDRQVLLTTHNPTALDALDLFDDEQFLYVVERNERSGETETRRLRPPKEMTREEWDKKTGGAKLSELWLDGFLGGMPPAEDF